nr:unnamed protein product [Spirometra erinaceieuropaei]
MYRLLAIREVCSVAWIKSEASTNLQSASIIPALLQRRPLRRLSRAQQPTPPPPPPPSPAMRIRSTPALTATAPSPHTSAWSVICESIAQKLMNQCLKHQPTPAALASTAHTAHRMGLFGHMRIHESGIDRNSDTLTTPSTSTGPSPTLAPLPCATITTNTITTITASSGADTDDADITCPHCSCTFTSRIGLVGHLRIHRTETGEPVPGAPTYTHHARLNCPHCPRTFRHRMGLFGHMRIHDDLR